MKFTYEGDNNKESIVSFMRNPTEPTEKPKEAEWADTPSDVVHLTTATFDDYMKNEPSALVMFYAPCNDAFSLLVCCNYYTRFNHQGAVIASE